MRTRAAAALGILLMLTACNVDANIKYVENRPSERPTVAELTLDTRIGNQVGKIVDETGSCGPLSAGAQNGGASARAQATQALKSLGDTRDFVLYVPTIITQANADEDALVAVFVPYKGPGTYSLKPTLVTGPGPSPNASRITGFLRIGDTSNPFIADQSQSLVHPTWFATDGELRVNPDERSGTLKMKLRSVSLIFGQNGLPSARIGEAPDASVSGRFTCVDLTA